MCKNVKVHRVHARNEVAANTILRYIVMAEVTSQIVLSNNTTPVICNHVGRNVPKSYACPSVCTQPAHDNIFMFSNHPRIWQTQSSFFFQFTSTNIHQYTISDHWSVCTKKSPHSTHHIIKP